MMRLKKHLFGYLGWLGHAPGLYVALKCDKFLFRTFEEGQSDDLFAVLHRVQLSKGGQLFEPQFTA